MSERISRRLFGILCIASLLSACASTPNITFEQAPKPAAKADQATVYVIRNPGYFASLIATDLFIDGRKLAGIRERNFTWFQIAPGKHTFGATWGWGATPELIKEYDFPAGGTTYLMLDSKIFGNQYSREFRPIPLDEALPLLRSYNYTPAGSR